MKIPPLKNRTAMHADTIQMLFWEDFLFGFITLLLRQITIHHRGHGEHREKRGIGFSSVCRLSIPALDDRRPDNLLCYII
jgi:hypothetical protein